MLSIVLIKILTLASTAYCQCTFDAHEKQCIFNLNGNQAGVSDKLQQIDEKLGKLVKQSAPQTIQKFKTEELIEKVEEFEKRLHHLEEIVKTAKFSENGM